MLGCPAHSLAWIDLVNEAEWGEVCQSNPAINLVPSTQTHIKELSMWKHLDLCGQNIRPHGLSTTTL
jgi:hypothetical protein